MNDRLEPRIRILLGSSIAIGPGKAALLEAIGDTGSIAAAGRRMGMSYRRAWLLAKTMNACFRGPLVMGLPPVVVGLVVYLALSRPGPLGGLGLLFTPAAMVIAQIVLVTPIVAAIARLILEDLWREYAELYLFDGVGRVRTICSLLWLGRLSMITAVLAGVGRAVAEVGAILIGGGNIAGVTRTMADRDCP